MFTKYEKSIRLAEMPFWNLRYRKRTVLIMCLDGNGRFLMGIKGNYYPEGICRMLGGGVDDNESVELAAIREVKEEMKISIKKDELIELVEIKLSASYKEKSFVHTVFVYFLNSKKDDYLASDDVTNILNLNVDDYMKLLTNFANLKDDDIHEEGDNSFSWGDYGKAYGFVHKVAFEEARKKALV